MRSTSVTPAEEAAAASAARQSGTSAKRCLQSTLPFLFGDHAFPPVGEQAASELHWRSDSLGKPYVGWSGATAERAAELGLNAAHLHVSNSHDGERNTVFAAYSPHLVGIGIDIVHLPRLRSPGKGTSYLLRLAHRFMSAREYDVFRAQSFQDDEEALRRRVAAHFSLMEAVSKALGTGLNLGFGIGRQGSLPRESICVAALLPGVIIEVEGAAANRVNCLGVTKQEAYWWDENNYVTTLAMLYND